MGRVTLGGLLVGGTVLTSGKILRRPSSCAFVEYGDEVVVMDTSN